MIVAMFAVLFRSGAFDFIHPNPSAVIMIVFWIAFRRVLLRSDLRLAPISRDADRPTRSLVGLRLGPYLLSKVAVLLPFLLLVDLLCSVSSEHSTDCLRSMERRSNAYVHVAPRRDRCTRTRSLDVRRGHEPDPGHSCAPAVVLSGCPVLVRSSPDRDGRRLPGAPMSALMPDRWAFEAIGHDLGVRHLFRSRRVETGPTAAPAVRERSTHATPCSIGSCFRSSSSCSSSAVAVCARPTEPHHRTVNVRSGPSASPCRLVRDATAERRTHDDSSAHRGLR